MWPLWIYRQGPSLALPGLSPLGRHPLPRWGSGANPWLMLAVT